MLSPSTTLYIASDYNLPPSTRKTILFISRFELFLACFSTDGNLGEQGYMKKIKNKLMETSPDDVEAFEKGAKAYGAKIAAGFKDFDFVGATSCLLGLDLHDVIVYWRVYEPGWNDRLAQLSRRRCDTLSRVRHLTFPYVRLWLTWFIDSGSTV